MTNNRDMEHIGERIRKIRKSNNLTQRQLEDKIEVGNSTVSGWEKMAMPPLEGICKICDYFKIPLWQFFAPEDLVIPGLDPDEAKYMRAFKEVPTNVQAMMIESNTLMYEAYLEGKKENKVLQKML